MILSEEHAPNGTPGRRGVGHALRQLIAVLAVVSAFNVFVDHTLGQERRERKTVHVRNWPGDERRNGVAPTIQTALARYADPLTVIRNCWIRPARCPWPMLAN